MQRHTHSHRIHEHLVNLNIFVLLCHFVEDFVPENHAVSLRIALGHHGQLLAWSRPCCLKRISHYSLDADAREDAHFGGDCVRTVFMRRTALA
jgi:hypothetical protein